VKEKQGSGNNTRESSGLRKGRGMESFGILPASNGEGSSPASRAAGFSLIEMMVAMFILTFGLLAAGQMIFVAMGSASLARAKGNLTVVAQDKLEFLADLYARNPDAADFAPGDHGPDYVQIVNPLDNTTLDRFEVTWKISAVVDPRPGKILQASQVRITVRPVSAGGGSNYKAYSNKAAVVVGILSPRT
jgi:prepilin-type N-terminal cleavage/methylation domain-containing protein